MIMKVTWRDAEYDNDSVPDELDSRDCLVETIGFFVSENKTYLTLARDRFEHIDGKKKIVDYTHFLRIPKAVILKRKELKCLN
jgi:hypothetical protein